MSIFSPATKKDAYLRCAITGPSGAGKTYTALTIATGLAQGQRVAVVDTESGSASKYAKDFVFDVGELRGDYHPQRYIDAIRDAEASGFRVLIIDSLSHAWFGDGGALALVDAASRRSKTGNSYAAWRDVTPLHNRLIQAILNAHMHVICTMRSKTEYIVEQNSHGKSAPRKVGLAPVQRDGMDYEFDVVIEMDRDNVAIIDKTRCPALSGRTYPQPGVDSPLVVELCAWLGDAPDESQYVAPTEPTPEPQEPPRRNCVAETVPAENTAPPETSAPKEAPMPTTKAGLAAAAWAICKKWACDETDWQAYFAGKGHAASKDAPMPHLENLLAKLRDRDAVLNEIEAKIGTAETGIYLASIGGILNADLKELARKLMEVT